MRPASPVSVRTTTVRRLVIASAAGLALAGTVGGVTEAAPARPAPGALAAAVGRAEAVARKEGVDASITVLDRTTGASARSADAGRQYMTASLVKVMIADDILTRREQGRVFLGSSDMASLKLMVTRSDDLAADLFWQRGGGEAIVERIAARYGLRNTRPNGRWDLTLTTTPDLVSLYNQIVSGRRTSPKVRDFLVGAMRGFQPTGTDGENQTFGLPQTLSREKTAGFKQGWMPMADGTWVHNTTAIVGPGNRYIVAVMAVQPAPKGEAPTVASLNRVTDAMFPTGRIGAARVVPKQ
ncbi:serine hydrolase [Tsukamurella sp. 8F]|uniref:serine hydrolase n=1 Tax=unclassified Tsukamurella TaxID=2633480 RepID=UPI0023B8DDBD|nr:MULTISPECIES: serine hydrolase [unclassified Tsukamurella]MDF0530955.1 serine hydrolase [Tsukamurella sp. 8J]MDF0588280.1 serine hydrolase [Tsukamurella sp. 8F]